MMSFRFTVPTWMSCNETSLRDLGILIKVPD